MEEQKWVIGVLLIVLLIGLAGLMDQKNQMPTDFIPGMQFIKDMIQTKQDIDEKRWSSGGTVEDISENPIRMKPDTIVFSPNLSTCHVSITEFNLPIYCCPPNDQTNEPFIDFKFPDPSKPRRIRRPIHEIVKDPEFLANYTKALRIMKSLPYEDPRSFMRQADVHCLYCTGAYDQKHSNTVLRVHRSWTFFPWHRMYVYFHERIMGSLIGDDNFALPFWNWDLPEGMIIPDMFMKEPFFDKERESKHFPPRMMDINYNFNDSSPIPNDADLIESNLAFMYNQMVSAAKKTILFMGCISRPGPDGVCDGMGTIESSPHNTVHGWVTDRKNPQWEDMGAFYAAARDPLFFGHHSNLDRIWDVYRFELGENREIDDPQWLDSYFFFYDEKLQLVRIKIRDVLDIDKLGYSFTPVEKPWFDARPKPSIPPKVARDLLKMRDHENQLGLVPGQCLLSTIRLKVQRPKTYRTKEEKKEEEEILVVYGIDVKKDKYAKFDVYVNAINETSLGPRHREFAGTFVYVARGVRRVLKKGEVQEHPKMNLNLGISELLEDLEADGDEIIWVSIVPRASSGTFLCIDGVRIEYLR